MRAEVNPSSDRPFAGLVLFLSLLCFGVSSARAGSDSWSSSPSNTNWNDGGNWVLGVVPNGTSDVAFFSTSSIRAPRLNADVDLDRVRFESGADAFTIDTNGHALRFFGAGVVDLSSRTQTLLTGMISSIISFNNSSSASDARIKTDGGLTVFHDTSNAGTANITTSVEFFSGSRQRGVLRFLDSSTAASATISNDRGEAANNVNLTQFFDTTTAANANITNTGGFSGPNFFGGQTEFHNSSKAGNATIDNNGGAGNAVSEGGVTLFLNTSGAQNATIINHGNHDDGSDPKGGETIFRNSASAGSALITNAANTTMHLGTNVGQAARTVFEDSSTAANATITNKGANVAGAIGGLTTFSGAATAANANITNDAGHNSQGSGGGITSFSGTATAGNATIANNAPTVLANGGETDFKGSSTAGQADITNLGAFMSGNFFTFSVTNFSETSKAGSANIHNQAGGSVTFSNSASAASAMITSSSTASDPTSGTAFRDTSTAGDATLINNAYGTISFFNNASASTSAITNRGNGFVGFNQNSTAGSAAITNASGNGNAATMLFLDSSTAHNATITNNNLGALGFHDTSNAGGAVITNNAQGFTNFDNNSTANNAAIFNNNGGETHFHNSSTADTSTVTTNNGGAVQFFESSSGGSASFVTNAGGEFDISSLTTPGTTAGSIEGAGTYFLGSKRLTVGSNNSFAQVSGLIRDGGIAAGANGSLTKIGTATLELDHANTYTGGTIVSDGRLLVNNGTGSATGTGAVTVQSGARFAGNGAVSGAVTIQANGNISPGDAGVGSLGTGNLTLAPSANFNVELDPANLFGNGLADLLKVTGSVSLSGADLILTLRSAPTLGASFEILDNNGTDPIIGRFAQGSQVSGTFGSQTYFFAINYQADDGSGFGFGNDITLTNIIPEPSTKVLLLLGIGILVVSRNYLAQWKRRSSDAARSALGV